MRVDVKKFIFLGSQEESASFFIEAQRQGFVEFIRSKKSHSVEVPLEMSQIIDAKKVLRHLEPLPQEELGTLQEGLELAQTIKSLADHIEKLKEEERLLGQEIVRIHVFGNFSIADLKYIETRANRSIQFFFAKTKQEHDGHLPEGLFYVGSAFDLDYYVSIASSPQTYPGLTLMKIEHSLGEVEEKLAQVRLELHQAEGKLKTFAKYKRYLDHILILLLNQYHLAQAQAGVGMLFDDQLFVVQGWVAANKMAQLSNLTSSYAVYYEEIAVDEGEAVPTSLENHGAARVGEDLVHIYDTPSTQDRDPSIWVLYVFAFFFAIIMGDAGYGLILLAVSFYLGMKMSKRSGLPKRFARLCLLLSVASIIWGVLINSWFGVSLDPQNPLRRFSLTTLLAEKKAEWVVKHPDSAVYQEWVKKYPDLALRSSAEGWIFTPVQKADKAVFEVLDRFSNDILMELAIFIGALHLIISFLRVIDQNWFGAGWIIFIVGCYLYFPSVVEATSLIHFVFHVPPVEGAQQGLILVIAGPLLAVTLAMIQRRSFGGIVEITNVIQVFADIMSYLRLYALGLASAMMSVTFNEIAETAGVVVAIPILLIGHTTNIVLSIMSGVIHGLRLNFLEWYRWSFTGGGKMLSPLKLLKSS